MLLAKFIKDGILCVIFKNNNIKIYTYDNLSDSLGPP